MSEVEVEGMAELKAQWAKVPENARAGIEQAINKGAAEFVALARAACPTTDLDQHPGQLRESIHSEPGRKPISKVIVADAKDSNGREYGAHVEFGHRTAGGHVPAYPFFYTSWRVVKKRIKGRVKRAISAAAKGMIGGE